MSVRLWREPGSRRALAYGKSAEMWSISPGIHPHIMPVMGGVVVTSSVELTLSSGVSLRLVLHQGVERFGWVAVLGTVVG